MGIALDLTGQKFNRLQVVRRLGNNKFKKTQWLCRCDCGNEVVVIGQNLVGGISKSCSCLQKEKVSKLNRTHGYAGEWGNRATEYSIWANMKTRCTNPKSNHWHLYGGKGVKVCEQWMHSFEQFLKDMGNRPSKEYSIDRISPDGDYEPSNCRWATAKEQTRNKSANVWLEVNGIRMVQADWARRWGITGALLKQHIRNGKTFQQVYNYFEAKTAQTKLLH
jgi:hypothetical protein